VPFIYSKTQLQSIRKPGTENFSIKAEIELHNILDIINNRDVQSELLPLPSASVVSR